MQRSMSSHFPPCYITGGRTAPPKVSNQLLASFFPLLLFVYWGLRARRRRGQFAPSHSFPATLTGSMLKYRTRSGTVPPSPVPPTLNPSLPAPRPPLGRYHNKTCPVIHPRRHRGGGGVMQPPSGFPRITRERIGSWSGNLVHLSVELFYIFPEKFQDRPHYDL